MHERVSPLMPEEKLHLIKHICKGWGPDVVLRQQVDGSWHITTPANSAEPQPAPIDGKGDDPVAAIEACWDRFAGQHGFVLAPSDNEQHHREPLRLRWDGMRFCEA